MSRARSEDEASQTIGIDYGTSTTQVSYLPTPGYPDLYRIGQGAGYEAFSIRSLIAVHPQGPNVRVGVEAATARTPWVVLPSLKRCLRCSLDKETGQGLCTNPPNLPLCLGLGRYKIGDRVWSVGDLIGSFIGEVAKRTPVKGTEEVRFSVPPIYAAPEVEVVRRAVEGGYAPSRGIVDRNEPTSALVTINQDAQLPNGLHIVVDVGGGTTDVATLELSDQRFEIHQPQSVMIAGDDFDGEVFKHFRSLEHVRISDTSDYVLREACRVAKEQLSTRLESQILGWHVTRGQFEDIIRPVAERLVTFVAEYARERLREFDRVQEVRVLSFHLVGGASRIPLLRQLLEARRFPVSRFRVESVTGSGISDVYKEHLAIFCVALGNLLEQRDVNLETLPYELKIYDGNRLKRTISAKTRFPVRFFVDYVDYDGALRITAEREAERFDLIDSSEPTVAPFQSSIGRVRGRRLPLRDLLANGKGATFHITSGGLIFVQGIRKDRWYEAPWKNRVDEERRREIARRARRSLGLQTVGEELDRR